MTPPQQKQSAKPDHCYQALRDNIGLTGSETPLKVISLCGPTAFTPLREVATGLARQYARVRANPAIIELSDADLPDSTSTVPGWTGFCTTVSTLAISRGQMRDYGFWDLLLLFSWQKRSARLLIHTAARPIATLDLMQGHVIGIHTPGRLFEKALLANLIRQGAASVITLRHWLGQEQFDPYTLLNKLKQAGDLDQKSFVLLHETALRETLFALGKLPQHEFTLTPLPEDSAPLQIRIENDAVDYRNLLLPDGFILKTLGQCSEKLGDVTLYAKTQFTLPREDSFQILLKILPLILKRHGVVLITLPRDLNQIHPSLMKLIDATIAVIPDVMTDKGSLVDFFTDLSRHTRVLGSVITSNFH